MIVSPKLQYEILETLSYLCVDKSADSKDSTLIRSPLVSGALHEECTWYDVEFAKDISQIFSEVYKSDEFQKLMSTLKKIVSEM